MPTPASSPTSIGHVHIDAVQTVVAEEVAPPGLAKTITVDSSLTAAAFSAHLRAVLYFPKPSSLDSWAVAARIKESLGAALSLDHLFSGRLRHDHDGLKLRLNDAGVRLIHGKADFAMSDVLSSEERETVEASLTSWENIDEEKPHFSALFYMQVTGFSDGGISIGVSCSLLLADPLTLSDFLRKWARVHSQMHAKEQFYAAHIFNLEALRKKGNKGYLKSTPIIGGGGGGGATKTVMFDGVEEAARMIESSPEEFLMVISESDRKGELKFVEYSKKEKAEESWSSVGDWLRVSELLLTGGDSPVEASWRIVMAEKRPLVVVMPPLSGGSGGGMVSVTFPHK